MLTSTAQCLLLLSLLPAHKWKPKCRGVLCLPHPSPPLQNHSGHLCIPCSIIRAGNCESLSHTLLWALKHLHLICPKTGKSISLSASFYQASCRSSTEFPVCSLLQSNLVLVFPEVFSWPSLESPSLTSSIFAEMQSSVTIFPIRVLCVSFYDSLLNVSSQLHRLKAMSSLSGLGKLCRGLLLCLCVPFKSI